MDIIAEYKRGDTRYRVYPDDCPEEPIKDWDVFGTMLCAHRRYRIGNMQVDEVIPEEDRAGFRSWSDIEDYIRCEWDAEIVLPVYLYDHGILSISTQSFVGRAHHAGWDSGQVGLIYCTRQEREEAGFTEEDAIKCMRSIVELENSYIQGAVWCFEIMKVHTCSADICCGFYGDYEDELAIFMEEHGDNIEDFEKVI